MEITVNQQELKRSDIPTRETRSRGYTGYTAIDTDGKMILSAKTRYSDGGVCHAQVFLYGKEGWGHGYGRASGYGYDKESTAIENALEKAGVQIRGLGGTGQTRQALEEVAKSISPNYLTLVVTWH